MAAAPPPSSFCHMSATDLILKEPLDYGGFGDVYLCYHVTLGQVVLKTMFTGPLRSESKKSLLEEGNIMASLNHERVVKLLGVIMEDRGCSLVMELIPRGNLMAMLQKVSVPVSIKGRIILEILDGMVYLTDKRVIHKDVKPENILVDKDFHIKIADMGLATCQTWSRLTKEESRRRSRIGQSAGARGAGTLSYMAPEHLESIHTESTEKSDVYSFAIVVWVILTGEEPYSNARSEEQISQCVRRGDRPAENLIPQDTPAQISLLMRNCWNHNPLQRPTFKEAYKSFHPFYLEQLEPLVEADLFNLRESYEGPDDLVEKMKSLSFTDERVSPVFPHARDSPAPLVSSDRSVPVEASIEDMHDIQSQPLMDFLQSDAHRPGGTQGPPSGPGPQLDEKLHRELLYHKHGSYENPPASGPFLHRAVPVSTVRQPEPDKPCASSVHSWTKAEQPSSQETQHQYASMDLPSTSLPTSISAPSLDQYNQQHPHSSFNRQKSCPVYPVHDTSAPDLAPGRLLPQDPGSIFIHNARGIQIGSSNTMMIREFDSPNSSLSPCSSTQSLIKEGIQKHENHVVTEEHFDLLRENIGSKWKLCARSLGLTDVEIETIHHDYYCDGLPEMVHQMLERWRMREGSAGCKMGKLCQALSRNIQLDVIQKMLDICEASAYVSSKRNGDF